MRTCGQMSRCLLVAAVLFAWCNSCAFAQAESRTNQPNSAAPEYDVATVKVNNTGSGAVHITINNDTLQATNVRLASMLEIAFDIRPEQILGLPHWAQVDRYDILAKVVDVDPKLARGLSDARQRAMLQHLLVDRFHLQTHIEKRTLSVLDLKVAKAGIKFAEWQKPADGQDAKKGWISVHNYAMTAVGVRMESLVRFLASQTHMPVVDETGLSGEYNFNLKWQPEEQGSDAGLHDQALPAIYAALPEQLGLKLESGKGPVDVLVVDNIEQPTEN